MNEQKNIALSVAGKDVIFTPNITAYTKYINEMTMSNKIAPAHNFLLRIVDAEYKEELDSLLKIPGAVLQIVGKVLDEYTPELDILVKN